MSAPKLLLITLFHHSDGKSETLGRGSAGSRGVQASRLLCNLRHLSVIYALRPEWGQKPFYWVLLLSKRHSVAVMPGVSLKTDGLH